MANNYTFKDATATTQTVKSTDNTGVHTPHVNVDNLETFIGSLTETAPVVDTASSGLNGRLQRIAQRITTLMSTLLSVNVKAINDTTTSTGNGTSDAGTQRVVIASNDTNLAAQTTALQIMDDWDNTASDGASVSGDVAHDSADAGEPVKIGFKAYELDGTEPGTAVAEGDRVNSISDKYGRQYVETSHPRFWHVSADYASAQTNTSLKAAPSAGTALYITDIMISNGATAGNITLLDGSGGTVLFEIYPAINGGAVMSLRNPIKLTDATALCLTSTTVTTHSVFIAGYID